ncbi:MAG: FAD:protein FMN transferase [Proteobacteria bacterium]|nr:FAD:protein FMN transferase [Pseudomonadota bacterium]
MTESVRLHDHGDYFIGHFKAMASPCELLIETRDPALAQACLQIAESEACRIEHKFSRYRDDNIIYQINHSNGKAVQVDDETAALLNYADQCYQISEGLFDITSGVLGKLWRFDGSNKIPSQEQINSLLPQIGWQKVHWQMPNITLPKGMEIDLGGIGKEYAVDRVTLLLRQETDVSILVNFGGDLAITHPRSKLAQGWRIGVADPRECMEQDADKALHYYLLQQGAMTTSGDAYRFIEHEGRRYGHILNPMTGWPAANAPKSVTVLAGTCLEAGILSTLAILKGDKASPFLESNNAEFWIT